MITVTVERMASEPPPDLIDRVWSGVEWRAVRHVISGVAIEYDDGRHQAVQVCADWRRRYHAMSIMRFRDSASRVSFFYSRPPEGVAQQTGFWEAQAGDGGTCLRLVRNLELSRGRIESTASFEMREAAYGSQLEKHLAAVLEVIVLK